jgi:hypothetical protein
LRTIVMIYAAGASGGRRIGKPPRVSLRRSGIGRIPVVTEP